MEIDSKHPKLFKIEYLILRILARKIVFIYTNSPATLRLIHAFPGIGVFFEGLHLNVHIIKHPGILLAGGRA
jgi:hypothetical protein